MSAWTIGPCALLDPQGRRAVDEASRAKLTIPPAARPTFLYRLLRTVFRLAARLLFRVRVGGLEHLPRGRDGRLAGGWICTGLPHRNWSEAFLLIATLPADRRIVTVADARTANRSAWRRFVARQLGGVVPVGGSRSAAAFSDHQQAAGAALSEGAVLAIAPEVGGPSRPPELRRISPAIGYIAVRNGAPIIPMVFGGTHELFLRRRIEIRVLPALGPAAVDGSEREAARRLTAGLIAQVAPVAAELHAAAEPSPGTRKRWRWLTGRYPDAR